jgi:surface antigen
MFEKDKSGQSEVTGTVDPASNAFAAMRPEVGGLPEPDLAYARAAVSEVLTKGGKDVSQAWENPSTGAHGAVTPLTSAYADGGRTCRQFLVSYVQGKTQTWLQGDACKFAGGSWEMRSLKPWQRS